MVKKMRSLSIRERGYTLMEVTVAMTVIALSSASVVALQNTAMIGGMQARRLDLASKIADTWIERLRGDAAGWNDSNTLSAGEHRWLKPANMALAAKPVDPQANWFLPVAVSPVTTGLSPFFDSVGREMVGAPANVEPIFCTNVRLESVRFTDSGNTIANTVAIRAEVRVFFRKDMGTIEKGCPSPTGLVVDDPTFQFVYASTVIRENGL